LSGSRKASLGVDLAQILTTHFLRLERALEVLPDQDLWWRPHADCLSVGTILLHLEGNLRQWVLAGLGGIEDERQRAQEFDGQRVGNSIELLGRLADTQNQAAALIAAIPEQDLHQQRTIQGFEVSTQGAILHVVEHFSWHVGQAVWIAKARAGETHGLAFYDDDQLG
jgi:uncharacterized damage-inducible protein DinB